MLNKWGIKHWLLLLALAPAIIISLMLGSYFTSLRLDELNTALNDRGIAVCTRLASQAEYGMFVNDPMALQQLGRRELNNEISSVLFYNKSGHEIISSGKIIPNATLPTTDITSLLIQPNQANDTISFTMPITMPEIIVEDYLDATEDGNPNLNSETLKNPIIGWVKVIVERRVTRIKEYNTLLHSILIMIFGLLISGLLASRLGLKVTEPILVLTRAVEKIKQGKLHTKVNTKAKWELAILESGFNTMASSLAAGHQELQNKIEQATADLRNTLETIEVQNFELNAARKEAETASKVKSEFLASMSHELRTPLNGIIGFINLLQKSNLAPRQADYITTIQKSANSLLSIINDILDFSKIEAGKLHLDIEPMNIFECIEDALTLLAPSAHEKNLEIIPIIYDDVPSMIKGDFLRIKQVITNLVNNSIKFTYEGSVILKAMLAHETLNEATLHISVQDTGIGLSEEQKKELFNAFNQLDSKITRKFGGTGLGLVICKKLVEQMRGVIDLESTPGKGSTFWFTIKVNKIAPQPKLYQNPLFNDVKILLYEEHPITRAMLKHLLNQWGFNVHVLDPIAKNSAICDLIIDKIKQAYHNNTPYQLVLIGVNLPDPKSNYIKTIVAAASQSYRCAVGVITNTTNHIVHGEILQEGVALCLAKPICRQKFYDALSDVCGGATATNSALLTAEHSNNFAISKNKLDKIKVLVVDDNNENLKIAVALLEIIGTEVATANNGNAALVASKHRKFNLIFMDIHMPILDGIETAELIRTTPNPNQNTPIVALSAHILLSEKTAMQQAQINDYLPKPINENQLRATIYKWTQRGTSNHQLVKATSSLVTETANANIVEPTVVKTSPDELAHTKHTLDFATKTKLNLLKTIDWQTAAQLAAGKLDLAKDLLNMLAAALPQDQAAIHTTYHAKDQAAMKEIVHKLHGACCYTGTPKLKQILQLLEAHLNKAGLSDVDEYLQLLDNEINNFLRLWQEELATVVL